MTLPVWNGTAADESSGDLTVLVSPTVTVTDKATGANATLASDRSGTGKSNPFTAGADGSIEFYVKPGRYKIVADDGSGNTATWDDQLIGTLHGIDQPAAGEFPEYDAGNDRWVARQAGYLNPEHATDSGTDAFVSATNTTVPGDGVKITRDFQSANTTTTPTLDGKTLTTRDGSALWAGAVSGPHDLQYASGTDTYLVLDPIPDIPVSTDLLDEDDMVSDSAAAVPTQQSVKAYADTKLAKPGTSTDPALAFDTWRTPNANRPTLVTVQVQAETNSTNPGQVAARFDESGGTTADYTIDIALAHESASNGFLIRASSSFIVPAGGSYQISNTSDPNSGNAIQDHREFTL